MIGQKKKPHMLILWDFIWLPDTFLGQTYHELLWIVDQTVCKENRSINMICTTVHVFTDNIKMWWEQQTGIHGAAKCVNSFYHIFDVYSDQQ